MSADLRAYLQPLAPLMEAARRALKETPFRLGDDPDDLLGAVVIAISAELSGPSLAVMGKLKQAEAELDAKDTQLAAQAEAMAELDDKATQAYEDRDEAAHRAEQAEALADEHAANARELGERLRQAEAERDQLRSADGRVRALHKPKTAKRVKPCGTHGPATVCSGCDVQEVTVCSHVGCHGWPCDTIAALDQDGGTDADT